MRPILVPETGMNATERKYGELLALRKAAGEIVDFMWEPVKLILVHNVKGKRNEMSYAPDFMIITKENVEFHEVKGHWREDARVKIKMASEMFYWFKFIAVQLKGKRWVYEEF